MIWKGEPYAEGWKHFVIIACGVGSDRRWSQREVGDCDYHPSGDAADWLNVS